MASSYISSTIAPSTTKPALSRLQAQLSQLELRENAINKRLEELRFKVPAVTNNLRQLDQFRTHLEPHVFAAHSLNSELLAPAAATASRVSGSVKALDDEQSRVQSVLRIVEQVIELKTCILGLASCMAANESEEAAEFVSRARKIPADIIDCQFANETVPTPESPHPPKVTLESAAEKLCGLFLQEFEHAAANGDGEKVTTYFKLFPLIGKEDVGLGAYSKYVCTGVSKRARDLIGSERTGMFYAAVLARMLEYVAGLIGVHAPLVGQHYGFGMMGKVVYKMQTEIDVQGGIVLDMFQDDKAINRKLAETKAYAYPYLMNSFNSNSLTARNPLGIARSSSPAPGARGTAETEDEGVDVKEIDAILSEMGFILSRWSLYFRFLALKEQEWTGIDLPEDEELPSLTPPSILVESTFHEKVKDRIVQPFISMSTYFFRRSVEKAFELDEMPADINQKNEPTDDTSPPLISSAVDDVMYIVNKLLHRTLHTSRYDVVSSVVSTITRVLTGDFIGMIQRKMRDEYYPKASNGLAPLDEKTVHFLVLINNLDIASTYTQRIVDRITSGTSEVSMVASDEYPATPLPNLFPFLTDSDKVSNLLQTLSSSFTTKAAELQTDALNTLFNQVIKPKLRPLLADCFSGIDYSQSRERSPDNASDSEGEALLPQDKVRVKFERGWKTLMGPLRAVLTQTPFTKLLNIVCAALAQIIERRLWAYLNTQTTGPGAKRPGGSIGGGVSPLGAIKLERDVAAIVNTVAVMGGWKIREVFKKCTEICLVLGEDDEDYQAEVDDGESVLTREEREKVRKGLLGER